MKRSLRRFAAWLLLAAMALSSAAPSFASRASAADLAALGICSQAARAATNDGSQGPDDGGQLGSNLHHCALCAPAAHAALPTTSPDFRLPPIELVSFELFPLYRHARAVYAGSIWRPRGPPMRA